jgi:ERCC4-related helicase
MNENNTIDKTDLFKAKKELNDFLAENPHLLPLQEKINEALKKSGSSQSNRMSVIFGMLMDSAKELQKALTELIDKTKEIK